jgi:hypothetical protein
MEYVPPPPVDASKVPYVKVRLPNVPVLKAPEVPKLHAKKVMVHPAGKAPKTKPCYGMTQPFKAGIHGVNPIFVG